MSSPSDAEARTSGTTAIEEAGDRPHPFFHYYGQLPHQQNMLQDHTRTSTYHKAISSNPADFAGKVVMDVGTGTGILAYFAAKAGAKKVYAVEASGMADSARLLLESNGFGDVIEVIKGKVEEVEIPDKVDVVISEPMGFLLVHERMLESYIAARQRFAVPEAKMFPSTGTIFLCPFTDEALHAEQVAKTTFWQTKDFYGLDLSCLEETAHGDAFSQPVVGYFDPACLLADDTVTYRIDFRTDSPGDLKDIEIPFEFEATKTAICHGIAGWFDVDFLGSNNTVKLSTAPDQPGTHWYQCRLLLRKPLALNETQRVTGSLRMTVNEHYSYNVTLTMKLDGTRIESVSHINLHDQLYHYMHNTESATSASGTHHGWE
jgi:histone-arginine methyltransferase CARM1